uniref:Uncharacterized protein n=1 Tax=Tanacetum cinerariifolium TaxID=118510 RepID=A0A6L2MC46_TANCI|nr:hypothetical protein [Tanacetum cinerariifolium]
MELRLQKGSIKATRQKVNDILGIPMGNTKLQDFDKRPDNDPFIAEWEAQYNNLRKPTPRAISLQMSCTTKADFMFKINFLILFGSTMGTLENGGRVPKKPSIRRWNTLMMRKRITMETSKGCLENLDHHEDFDPDEDQNGIDLDKGLDVYIEPLSERKPVTKEKFYEKIIEKLTKITEERSELIETLRERMTKFGEDQGISYFYDQYKNLFKHAELNLYDSSMDEYSESESDADNKKKKNDGEEKKEKRNYISKGTEEVGREQKDNEEDDQYDLNNKHEFEKLSRDDREVVFSMEVDETKNEKEKQTENVKEQQAEKEAKKEDKQDDIGKGTEEARSETKIDGEEVHAKVDDPN